MFYHWHVQHQHFYKKRIVFFLLCWDFIREIHIFFCDFLYNFLPTLTNKKRIVLYVCYLINFERCTVWLRFLSLFYEHGIIYNLENYICLLYKTRLISLLDLSTSCFKNFIQLLQFRTNIRLALYILLYFLYWSPKLFLKKILLEDIISIDIFSWITKSTSSVTNVDMIYCLNEFNSALHFYLIVSQSHSPFVQYVKIKPSVQLLFHFTMSVSSEKLLI